MKKAVIFDLDGTLADTIQDIGAAANRALARRSLPQHELSAYKLMVGNGFRNLVTLALPPAQRSESLIEEMRVQASADYGEHCLDETRPYPGVEELLDTLVSRGIILAVLSNKPHELTVKCVAGLFPRVVFASVLGETGDYPRKPDPASTLETCARLGIDVKDALYLGDSGVDMQTARAAGMTALGALWGFRSRAELVENGADALLAGPLDLLNYL